MQTLDALNTLATLLQVITNGIASAAQVSAVIQKAQAEGRSDLTAEEMTAIRGVDDAARKLLADAIAERGVG